MTPTLAEPRAIALTLEGLEARYRWMQIGLVGLGVFVLIALFLLSLLLSTRPDVVTAREFQLRDPLGRVRAELVAPRQGAGPSSLRFYDGQGKPQALLVVDATGPALTFYGTAGDPRLWIGLVKDAPAIELLGETGTPQARIGVEKGEPTLRLASADGKPIPMSIEPAKGAKGLRTARATKRPCTAGTLGCTTQVSSTPRTFLDRLLGR
ncbi:MAG: hypothetical protein QOD06_3273 [Candidatus Binatota bacterium]|jgi:hypothetical protein|nr:hypothetical protein [Candidatus Binatota bacterium]